MTNYCILIIGHIRYCQYTCYANFTIPFNGSFRPLPFDRLSYAVASGREGERELFVILEFVKNERSIWGGAIIKSRLYRDELVELSGFVIVFCK